MIDQSHSSSQKYFIWLRLLIFGVMNFVVFLTNTWTTIDLEEIIQDNLGVDPAQMSTIASFMYSGFFAGMLVSCFLWPFVVRLLPKIWCIISAFVVVGCLNLFCYYLTNIHFIILCRFLSGVFQNIHTVGKDFLFDVFSTEYAKKGLILDSCFGLLGHLVAPVIGHWLYVHSHKSFETTCFKVAMIFFTTILIFYLFFAICRDHTRRVPSNNSSSTIDYKKLDRQTPSSKSGNHKWQTPPSTPNQLEIRELQADSKPPTHFAAHDGRDQLVVSMQQDTSPISRTSQARNISGESLESSFSSETDISTQNETLWSVLRSSFRDKQMRSLMVLYGISSACTNSEILIAMLYIQTKWAEQGLGLVPEQVVSLSVVCFFPSVVILLYSGEVVPSRIPVKTFTKSVIYIFALSVLSLPLIRDLCPDAWAPHASVGASDRP